MSRFAYIVGRCRPWRQQYVDATSGRHVHVLYTWSNSISQLASSLAKCSLADNHHSSVGLGNAGGEYVRRRAEREVVGVLETWAWYGHSSCIKLFWE